MAARESARLSGVLLVGLANEDGFQGCHARSSRIPNEELYDESWAVTGDLS
jgi:hypothetical protein